MHLKSSILRVREQVKELNILKFQFSAVWRQNYLSEIDPDSFCLFINFANSILLSPILFQFCQLRFWRPTARALLNYPLSPWLCIHLLNPAEIEIPWGLSGKLAVPIEICILPTLNSSHLEVTDVDGFHVSSMAGIVHVVVSSTAAMNKVSPNVIGL